MVIALVLNSTTTGAGALRPTGATLTGPTCSRHTPVSVPSSSTAVALLDGGLPGAQHAEGPGAGLRRAGKLRVWCRKDLLGRDDLHAVGLGWSKVESLQRPRVWGVQINLLGNAYNF